MSAYDRLHLNSRSGSVQLEMVSGPPLEEIDAAEKEKKKEEKKKKSNERVYGTLYDPFPADYTSTWFIFPRCFFNTNTPLIPIMSLPGT